ncbi:hypothetical protein KP509_08G063200 [Ceratopteris richardii]|uniref:CCDC93 N-terminal domain-containing protein n=1 Tax=Ceratopteris richardii TaxID=49495 RepID=A0A8T2UAL2_CERRI|nr:hypothetical protein KP509_08G063200 [Ceratopteris richardii]
MEGNEELFQKIVELLVVAGYTRARSQSLCPFDKLTGGLVWCINGCDVDLDIDHFYDDNAAPEYKQKVCEAIEKALHVMECPYPLQAHQVQRLDYSAVYHVVQWLAKCAVSDQVSRLASAKKIDHPIDGKVEVRHEV